ncbi:tRNA dimethylallyltransferase [Chitinophaga jiangningensis]|uniref:tRNA dimethylallyltransferase n=1 Tax=Chitinophaga jiangningensis TaxID=1419482 RepID=A0A1M7CEE5_9BACT|nr:tRNA (adenosine(37)-N6)-dimethylallyltransferase MiaA [Chitinophaga jiangningensis]SHL65625.1 tRNA dimethylallyltransferase [Chitinophaga jiangningensis]
MQKTVIVIAGPTASGKTATAIRIAQLFNTSVISADSRQCYKEISIGTAKPSPQELAAVPHYFINSHSIREEVNAGMYEKLALQYCEEIFATNDVAVMCGGTGLYIKAFAEGIDEMPEIPAAVRQSITNQYAEKGISWLQEELQRRDPDFYAGAEIHNPARLMRALEVLEATGQSISVFRTATKRQRDFRIIKIGLHLPKEILHDNINRRVDMMVSAGLVDEVRAVLAFRNHNALRTVGYTEIFNYLDGNLTLPQAIEDIKVHTRQYAKRQLTWFRKDPGYQWFDAREGEQIDAWLQQQMDT